MKKHIKDVAASLNHLSIAIIGIALILLGYFLWPRGGEEQVVVIDEEKMVEEQVPCDLRRAVDGVCVESSAAQQAPFVAVMVENHFQADPLSGIEHASVVYEAPVEGNIPRLMVLFPVGKSVEKVGPIRSARPYFVDWLGAYQNTLYLHVGGSPAALEQIEEENIFDLNEFYRGWYYWRADDRAAPHNVYSSSDLWRNARDRYGSVEMDFDVDPWTFALGEECTERCHEQIDISFNRTYQVSWRFNTSTQQYERWQFGSPHTSDSGEQFVADTVIVQVVDAEIIDDVGRLFIETNTSGKAYVVKEGQVLPVRWRKASNDSRTQWVDDFGDPVPLRPGKIWVEVVTEAMIDV